LTSRHGLYATLFDAFLEARDGDRGELPPPDYQKISYPGADVESQADATAEQNLAR
jgi:hypothetical protein